MCSTFITILFYINQFIIAIVRNKFKQFSDRDFMFYFVYNSRFNLKDDVLSYIVDTNFSCVHVRNAFNFSIMISQRNRLKIL